MEWSRHRRRWRALQSLNRYLQECGAVLAEQNLIPQERPDVEYAAQLLPEVLGEAETLLAGGASVAPRRATKRAPC